MSNVVLSVEIKDKSVTDFFRTVNRQLDQIEGKGKKAFDGVEKGAQLSSVKIGAVAGIVTSLTNSLIELGREGAQAFLEIIEGGVALNASIEGTERVFSNLFNDPNLGAETVAFLQETARLLRIGQEEALTFGQRILPRTSDLETFQSLLRSTTIQARTTGQSVNELEFSIREALSGDFVSIRDRFDLSRATIDRIKELGEEIGLDKALAQELAAEFERLGKNDLGGGTLTGELAALRASFENLQIALSKPVFVEVKEQVADILAVFDSQNVAIDKAAQAWGDLIALIADFIGTEISQVIDSIDFANVEALAVSLAKATNAGLLLIDILLETENAGSTIERLVVVVDALAVTIEKVAVVIGALGPALDIVSGSLNPLGRLGSLAFGAIPTEAEKAETGVNSLSDALAAYEKRNSEIIQSNFERATSSGEVAKADTEAIDAALGNKKAVEDAAAAAEEAAEAQAELAEAIAKVNEESESGSLKIQIDQQRELAKAAREAADRLLEIEKNNLRALEDIRRNNANDVAAAGRDLSRKEQDIAREQARERIDLEIDTASQRVQARQRLADRLAEIERGLARSEQEGAINVDAIAVARARRQAAFDSEDATIDAGNEIRDIEQQATERREALKRSQQAEIEDAQIANQRKLEDLRISLDEAFEAQRINNERALIDFQEKQEIEARERAIKNQQEIDDFNAKQQAKLAVLNVSLQAQLEAEQAALNASVEATAAAEAEKTRIVEEQAARRRAARVAAQNQTTTRTGNSNNTGRVGGIPEFANGGQFRVGGSGGVDSQLVQFMASPDETVTITNPAKGQRAPVAGLNSLLASSPQALPLAAMGGGQSIDKSVNLNLGQMIGGSTLQDEIDSRIEQNQMLRQLKQVLGSL